MEVSWQQNSSYFGLFDQNVSMILSMKGFFEANWSSPLLVHSLDTACEFGPMKYKQQRRTPLA